MSNKKKWDKTSYRFRENYRRIMAHYRKQMGEEEFARVMSLLKRCTQRNDPETHQYTFIHTPKDDNAFS